MTLTHACPHTETFVSAQWRQTFASVHLSSTQTQYTQSMQCWGRISRELMCVTIGINTLPKSFNPEPSTDTAGGKGWQGARGSAGCVDGTLFEAGSYWCGTNLNFVPILIELLCLNLPLYIPKYGASPLRSRWGRHVNQPSTAFD